MMLRRRTMMASGGGGLPSGYTAYDWVQADSSTGTPVIDTGILLKSGAAFNSKWSFEGKFAKCEEFPVDWLHYCMFLNRYENYDNCFGIRKAGNLVTNKIKFNYNDRFGGTENLVSTIINIGEWHSFTLTHKDNGERGGKLSLDGIDTNSVNVANNEASGNLCLLGIGTHPAYYCRFARFKIYDNGSLAADLVPAKRDADGVVGFYDVVRNTFYAPTTAGVTLLCGYGFDNFNA